MHVHVHVAAMKVHVYSTLPAAHESSPKCWNPREMFCDFIELCHISPTWRDTTTEEVWVRMCLPSPYDRALTCCCNVLMSEFSLERSCLITWVSSWMSVVGSPNRLRPRATAQLRRQTNYMYMYCCFEFVGSQLHWWFVVDEQTPQLHFHL